MKTTVLVSNFLSRTWLGLFLLGLLSCGINFVSGQYCIGVHNSAEFLEDNCCNRDVEPRDKCVDNEFCFGVAISHPTATLSGCCEDYQSCGAMHTMFDALNKLEILSITDFAICICAVVAILVKLLVRFVLCIKDDQASRKRELGVKCNQAQFISEIINFGFAIATIVIIQSSKALVTAYELLDAECFPGSRNGKTVGDVVSQLDGYYAIAITELVLDFVLFIAHLIVAKKLERSVDEPYLHRLEAAADVFEVLDFILAGIKLFAILQPAIQELDNLYNTLAYTAKDAPILSGCILSCCLAGSIVNPAAAVPSTQPTQRTSNPSNVRPSVAVVSQMPTPIQPTFSAAEILTTPSGQTLLPSNVPTTSISAIPTVLTDFPTATPMPPTLAPITVPPTSTAPTQPPTPFPTLTTEAPTNPLSPIDISRARWDPLVPQVFGNVLAIFGRHISISNDGKTFAISHNGPNVYDLNSSDTTEWMPDSTVFMSSTVTRAVVSGNGLTLAVSRSYVVIVFRRTKRDGEWLQVGSAFSVSSSNLNTALSNDGTTIAIYSEEQDWRGSVTVYDLQQNNVWARRGQVLSGDAVVDHFGYGLSLSRDALFLAIGSPQKQLPDTAGYCRVYKWNAENDWWEQLGDDILGNDPGAQFGNRIVISDDGQRVLITEPYAQLDPVPPNVKVYDLNSGIWSQVGQTFTVEEEHGLEISIALSGDGKVLALGAWFLNGPTGSDCGMVQVFTQSADDVQQWDQVGNDIYGEKAGDYWGESVALSRDGRTLAIGGILVSEAYRGVVATYVLRP